MSLSSLPCKREDEFIFSSLSAVSTVCSQSGFASREVAVMLPCFNEEKDLPQLLQRIREVFVCSGLPYRIVVIDDGSTDRTAEIVEAASRSLPIELVRHERNYGLGAALQSGFNALRDFHGVVVTMDADNSHDPALIPAMVDRLDEGYEVVIASRFQRGGCAVGVKRHRRFLSWFASFLTRTLFSYRNVRDYSSGYRAYAPRALQRVRERYGDAFVTERSFACMLELLLKLRSVRARASEIPLVLRYDFKLGRSKARILWTAARYFVVMFQLFRVRFPRGCSYCSRM